MTGDRSGTSTALMLLAAGIGGALVALILANRQIERAAAVVQAEAEAAVSQA